MGPLIVASKHQSMWETFALMQFFDAPLFIYKRELAWIPFFGWYLMKSGMIGVDRSGGMRSLMEMARRAPKEIRSGRQLIIFPEGTRTPVGAPPDYMTGVGQIYASSGVPCQPVALNSGLFWPRRTFMRYPGTLVVEFLDPLPAGLNRKEFIVRIATVIEAATNRLVDAAREEQAQLFGVVPSAPGKKVASDPSPHGGEGPARSGVRSTRWTIRCALPGLAPSRPPSLRARHRSLQRG